MPPKKADVGAKEDKGGKPTSATTLVTNAAKPASVGPNESNAEKPPTWFHEEFEKGFDRIQSLLDRKLNSLATSVETLISDNRALGLRVKEIEGKQADHTESLDFLHNDLGDHKKKTEEEISDLKDKLDDLENRARRQNLRLVGFPEGVEGSNAITFLEEWLPKILGLESGTPIEIERAHRTLQRRPDEGGRPRAMVIRLLRFTDVTRILDAARKKRSLLYGNSNIMIFRDMSTTLYRKRKTFAPLKKKLHDRNISFRLLHPTNLVMDLPEGRRTFTSPVSAENYLGKHHPDVLT